MDGVEASATTCIALGANLPGPAGSPAATLVAVRSLLTSVLRNRSYGRLEWSPLFRTAAVGGPTDQPDYLNAVVLAWGHQEAKPLGLLQELQTLEQQFGRQRAVHWGPRSLDLDLLWCGATSIQTPDLELPHPRLTERAFVLAPLAAIAPHLVPPGAPGSVTALLHPLQCRADRLNGTPGWPE